MNGQTTLALAGAALTLALLAAGAASQEAGPAATVKIGMAGSLVSFEAMDAPGARNVVAKVVADDSARESLEGILDAAKAAADQMLVENCHVVEALRDALLERDELIADEITDVIDQAQARHASPTDIDLRANGGVTARF